jgi:molybdopterin synthase sulfur carrier subunit
MNGQLPKVQVLLPSVLRPLCLGKSELESQGESVLEVLLRLFDVHPRLGERLLDEKGNLRRYVSLFLGDEDVRGLGGLSARVKDGDVLTVVPAISGGARCP